MATAEREKAVILTMKSKLISVLEDLDEDGSGTISRSEFDSLMSVPTAVEALKELGVDPTFLVSLSDHIFRPNAMSSVNMGHKKTTQQKESGAAGSQPIADSEEDEDEEEYAMTFLE